MSGDERRYDDKELKKIIQLAIEIQRRDSDRHPDAGSDRTGDGLSISEIEQAGEEIGLSVNLIRQAAAELDTSSDSAPLRKFLGGPTSVVVTGFVDLNVSEETLQELDATMRTIAGTQGDGQAHGSTFSWATSRADITTRGFATEVSVYAASGGTTVEVRERLGQLAGGIYGGIVGGVGLGAGLGVGLGVGLGALGSGLIAGIIAVGTLVASYGLSRLIYSSIIKQRKSATNGILSRVVAFLKDKPGTTPALPES